MQAGDIDLRIGKLTADIEKLNEKAAKKKKEIEALKKKKHALEVQERNTHNEKIISEMEKGINGQVTKEMIEEFLRFQKMNCSNESNCQEGSNDYQG